MVVVFQSEDSHLHSMTYPQKHSCDENGDVFGDMTSLAANSNYNSYKALFQVNSYGRSFNAGITQPTDPPILLGNDQYPKGKNWVFPTRHYGIDL